MRANPPLPGGISAARFSGRRIGLCALHALQIRLIARSPFKRAAAAQVSNEFQLDPNTIGRLPARKNLLRLNFERSKLRQSSRRCLGEFWVLPFVARSAQHSTTQL